jgi:hypothetical protein
LPAASIDGSIDHDSETNVENVPHLHYLTQDKIALVSKQATLDPKKKDLSNAFQQEFEEFMLCNAPFAAMTPPLCTVDIAPDGPSVPIISQDDNDVLWQNLWRMM